jgi:2-polyprenyl-3-methyl-5-hydroxy-6-metoxy-1,4-benzoquinol methylase
VTSFNPVECPACAGTPVRQVRRVGEQDVLECGVCGLHYSSPMREADAAWYAGDADYAQTLGAEAATVLRHVYSDRLAAGINPVEWLGPNHLAFLARQRNIGGTLLDVGCGEGTFLAAASSRYDVYGVEPDPEAAGRARTLLPERITTGTLSDLPSEPPNYDVITLFEVLEHVADPLETLVACRKLLGPGGVIVISVPNRLRRGADADPVDWPPNHLTRWTDRAMKAILSRAELSARHCHTRKTSRYGYWEAGWLLSSRLPMFGRSVRLRRLAGLLWLPLWPLYAARGDSTYGIFVEAVADHE